MTAFNPIPPSAALEMMARIPEAHSLLADLAQAGIVKAYARLLEIEGPKGKSSSRDKRLPADVWKRVVSEWNVKDIFASGTVRIPAGIAKSDEPAIVAIGIRFDPASVKRAAQEHGQLSAPVQVEEQVQLRVGINRRPRPHITSTVRGGFCFGDVLLLGIAE